MGENRKPRKKTGAIVVAVVLILLLPMFYVAGAGPALAMVSTGTITVEQYWGVYWPLENATGSTEFHEPLYSYQRWCGAEGFIRADASGNHAVFIHIE